MRFARAKVALEHHLGSLSGHLFVDLFALWQHMFAMVVCIGTQVGFGAKSIVKTNVLRESNCLCKLAAKSSPKRSQSQILETFGVMLLAFWCALV